MRILIFTFLCLLLNVSALSSSYKCKQLHGLAQKAGNGPIRLDTASFNSLVMDKPRNYSVVVTLTALGAEFGCSVCKEWQTEQTLLVGGWNKQAASKGCNIFFGVLDFKDGQEIFRQMQIRSVPLVLHYPPTEGPFVPPLPEVTSSSQKLPEVGAPETYDLHRRGALAEDLARWLESNSLQHPQISIRRPLDYARIVTTLLVLGVLAAAGKLVFKNFGGVFQAKALWMILSLMLIIVMISGYMWNQIRSPPYMGKELWAPGFSSQYVAETQVMAAMYAITATSFVLLAVGPEKIADPDKRKIFTYVILIIFLVAYSTHLKVFRIKNGSYPFKLLF